MKRIMSHQIKLGLLWLLVLLVLGPVMIGCSRSKPSSIPAASPIRLPGVPGLSVNKLFSEVDGFIQVEAESIHTNDADGTLQGWTEVQGDSISATASGKSYMVTLRDTMVTADDVWFNGTGFLPPSGSGAMLSYKVYFNTPGLYYVWLRSHSTGSKNNAVHVGVDGYWPESSAMVQWCQGNNEWIWSSAQRVETQPCGTPNTIKLNILETGHHSIHFAVAGEGFKFDEFIMTLDKNFSP